MIKGTLEVKTWFCSFWDFRDWLRDLLLPLVKSLNYPTGDKGHSGHNLDGNRNRAGNMILKWLHCQRITIMLGVMCFVLCIEDKQYSKLWRLASLGRLLPGIPVKEPLAWEPQILSKTHSSHEWCWSINLKNLISLRLNAFWTGVQQYWYMYRILESAKITHFFGGKL